MVRGSSETLVAKVTVEAHLTHSGHMPGCASDAQRRDLNGELLEMLRNEIRHVTSNITYLRLKVRHCVRMLSYSWGEVGGLTVVQRVLHDGLCVALRCCFVGSAVPGRAGNSGLVL